MLRILGSLVAALLSLVFAGSAWGAATISIAGGEVVVAGSDASEDLLLRADDERVFVRARAGEPEAPALGAGCEEFEVDEVVCVVGSSGVRVRAVLGGGDDRLEVLGIGEGELSAVAADLGAGDDRFDGSALDETVAPGTGSDAVNAGAGEDTVTYESHPGPAGLRYVGGASATATATIGADTDALSGAERIVGTPRADKLTGGPGAERLLGGAGNDAIAVTGPGRTAPDSVDCGSGRDSVAAQAGYDTVAGCEIVNGVDTAPIKPPPYPPILPPDLAPPAPPELKVIPPAGGLLPTPRGVVDVVVRCAQSCAGKQAQLTPPAANGNGLPEGWPKAFAPLIETAKREALLRKLAEAAAYEKDDVDRLAAELERMRQAHERLVKDAEVLERRERDRRDAAARLRDEARRRALETALAFQRQRELALQQAVAALAAAAIDAALLQAIADKAKSDRLSELAKAKLGDTKTGGTPRAGKTAKRAAVTAAARRSALGRWFARRAAVALPTARASLRATKTAGVYRARVRMPVWLRSLGRALRRGGTTAMPLRLRVGDDSARVRLRLRR